jgi:hypothetical protein
MMRRYGQAQRALVVRHGRFRVVHYAPAATSAVLLAQLLWLPRRARRYVGLLDAALVAGAVALLAARVPPARWAAVLDYSVLAVVQWHRGYWEGLRPHP